MVLQQGSNGFEQQGALCPSSTIDPGISDIQCNMEYTENITIFNLRMVRLSPMSMVKSFAREVHGKILDLAILAVRSSHCISASSRELPLLCAPALQGTTSLENSYDYLQHPFYRRSYFN